MITLNELKKHFHGIILFAVIFIILGGFIFLVIGMKNAVPYGTSEKIVSPSPVVTTGPILKNTGWNLYSKPDAEVSIEYPGNWKYMTLVKNPDTVLGVSFYPVKFPENTITLMVYNAKGMKSPTDWFHLYATEKMKNAVNPPGKYLLFGVKKINNTGTGTDSFIAFSKKYSDTNGEGILLLHGKYVYVLSHRSGQNDNEILDKMFSSLTFPE